MDKVSTLLLASIHGIARLEQNDTNWRETNRIVEEKDLETIATQGQYAVAGGKDGIQRSEDGGCHWSPSNTGLNIRYIRWLAFHPTREGLLFAGTQKASVFISYDAGANWSECSEVAELRDQYAWALPYSKEAGCVRGFAFHGKRIYAAVEQGGLLFSDNEGLGWAHVNGTCKSPTSRPGEYELHPDVHSVVSHPTSPDLVYAPTGNGLYRSKDGGNRWEWLYDCYCRAVWVDPKNDQQIILGPADDVSENGRIEKSLDGGESWQLVVHGLDTPWKEHMVQRFVDLGDRLIAVISNGRMFISDPRTCIWESFLPEQTGVQMVATVP